MNTSTRRWLIVLLLALFASFTSFVRAQENKNEYSAAEIGWKTLVPADGWKHMTAKEKTVLTDTGDEAIKKSTGQSIDISGLTELLNLRKDAFNTFLSTIEPYDEAKDGSYAETQKSVRQIILDAYKAQNLKIGHVRDGKELVDGLEFTTLEPEIMHPKNPEEVLLTQKMYSCLINGYDFGMTLSTNNPKDRRALETVVAASKFYIRK